MLGDSARFAQWTSLIADLKSDPGFGPLGELASTVAYGNLSAFCGACCGGMYLVTGHLDEAEAELLRAIADLEASGMESRCVHPVTQLAELRVLQGRFEEAQALLGYPLVVKPNKQGSTVGLTIFRRERGSRDVTRRTASSGPTRWRSGKRRAPRRARTSGGCPRR